MQMPCKKGRKSQWKRGNDHSNNKYTQAPRHKLSNQSTNILNAIFGWADG